MVWRFLFLLDIEFNFLQNPRRDVPLSITITLVTITALYVLTSLSLSGLSSYQNISSEGGFVEAFREKGYSWAANVLKYHCESLD